jgi:hypothetical protein
MKTTIKTIRPPLKLGLLAPLAVACLSMAPHARADTILLAQTTLISGTEATDDTFTAKSAGAITMDLQGLSWPLPLQALSFSITSASQVLEQSSGTDMMSDVLTFNVNPGTYYAHIMATAGSGPLELGLYSMLMTFTASSTPPPSVPLPASGWMLLTGMFVLIGLVRAIRPLEVSGTAAA